MGKVVCPRCSKEMTILDDFDHNISKLGYVEVEGHIWVCDNPDCEYGSYNLHRYKAGESGGYYGRTSSSHAEQEY